MPRENKRSKKIQRAATLYYDEELQPLSSQTPKSEGSEKIN
jgi:hypothetical protein